MNQLNDGQLLAAYLKEHSEAAFSELVRRHLDLTYSAALRMVCDAHLAADVCQNAFVELARGGPELAARPVLAGWLHRTAQNLAAKLVRSEVRRRAREKEAVAMNELLGSADEWEKIAPQLDAGLSELGDSDRDALLLRYFERKSLREVADILGISEDAAQKRVGRAVERLREFFGEKGIGAGTATVVAIISANAVQSAPAGLGHAVLGAACAKALGAGALATHGTLTAHWLNAKAAVAIALSALVAASGTYMLQHRDVTRLQNESRRAQANQKTLTTERDEALTALAEKNQQLAALQTDRAEILRLRGQVGALRREKTGLEASNRQLEAVSLQPQAGQAPQEAASAPDKNIHSCPSKGAKERLAGFGMNCVDCHIPDAPGDNTPETRARAKAQTCRGFLKYIAVAARAWADEHGGSLPSDFPAMNKQLQTLSVLYCP